MRQEISTSTTSQLEQSLGNSHSVARVAPVRTTRRDRFSISCAGRARARSRRLSRRRSITSIPSWQRNSRRVATAAAEASAKEIQSFDPEELRVTRIRALRGPNYWRLAPVIAGDVHQGSLEKIKTTDVPGFTERL